MRLTFPWLSADYVSDWARTVHAGAGLDRGCQVLPEVGDEVVTDAGTLRVERVDGARIVRLEASRG